MSQRASRRPRTHGFTIIEILVVATLLGIIAAIAIPNFGAAKMTSNETAALASLRTIGKASLMWNGRFGEYPGISSGDGLGDMSDPAVKPSPYLDHVLGSGQKGSYLFVYTGAADGWNCVATPAALDAGTRSFYLDHTGLIRVEGDFVTNGPATAAHPPLD